jgi:hypothetical protein
MFWLFIMMARTVCSLLISLVLGQGFASAQALFFGQNTGGAISSSILASSRSINWSLAGATQPARSTVCSTPSLTSGSGACAANTSAIQSAIGSCSANDVVSINSGTWYIDGIDFANGGTAHSNITLRGAGPNSTFFIQCASSINDYGGSFASDISVGNGGSNNWTGAPNNSCQWTAGYALGSASLTLTSCTSAPTMGVWLILDQDNLLNDPGNLFPSDATNNAGSVGPPYAAQDNSAASSAPGRNCSTAGTVTNCAGGDNFDRNQVQIVQVTSVSGGGPYTVGITPGLYSPNWTSGQNPGAWWATAPIQNVGLENFSIDHTLSTGESGVLFYNCLNCWMKDIRSIKANRNHVWMVYSAHDTVQDSYFYQTQSSSSQSYGVESWLGSDHLVTNNIFQQVTSPRLAGNEMGSVFSYNYTISNNYITPNQWQQCGYLSHDAFGMFNLIEGNVTDCIQVDDIHGSNAFTTIFRNQATGRDSCTTSGGSGSCPKTQQTLAIIGMAGGRYLNILANILGTAAYHNTYQANYPTTTNFNTSIYSFGWSGTQATQFFYSGTSGPSIPNDSTQIGTAYRWGNYDTVNGSTQFNFAEVPTTGLYAQPLPSVTSFPNSLYLSAAPQSFTDAGLPWPGIGPDITGAIGPGNHVNLNPAANCYLNTMAGPANGSGGVLAFTCTPY